MTDRKICSHCGRYLSSFSARCDCRKNAQLVFETALGQELLYHYGTLLCVRAYQLDDLGVDYDRGDVNDEGEILLPVQDFPQGQTLHTYTSDGWCISLTRTGEER